MGNVDLRLGLRLRNRMGMGSLFVLIADQRVGPGAKGASRGFVSTGRDQPREIPYPLRGRGA